MLASIVSFVANSLTITALVGYIFALWAALLVWTWFDISARTDNILYRLGAVLIVATGAILGFAIYLLLRPAYTTEEAKIREVEGAILTSQSEFLSCSSCHQAVREDFAYCPNCSLKLYSKCSECDKQINVSWNACPFCGRERKIPLPAKPAVEPTKPAEVPVITEVPARIEVVGKGRVPSLTFFSTLAGLLKRRDVKKRTAKRAKAHGSTFGKTKKSPRAAKAKKA
ncbi:MAG: hypothetical protein A2126_04725 [Candidatus Woykebacteria bacterium GWB1_45_5]|uniref:DZANK-type domain-containing protein n=2 Tax=Candidatus Woykeibacteriota TaxID=1817899 RepID=A0A1G1W315_9BACT|nr:MAG: hypothetical protein A2113_02450 [Candidatus Woykebacteria bacterium GWA1_44_8]OGY24792.1 MAG: hypothetical protein A2126_04725 [Candidatus Woykebacteria bacterium GWB1_45_5]